MSRNLNYRKAIVAVLAMWSFLFTGVAVAPAAFAGGTLPPTVYGTPIVSMGAAVDTNRVTSVVSAHLNYTEVMNIMAKGLPKTQQRKCVTIKKIRVTYKLGGKTFKAGKKYYTDYYAWKGGKTVHVWHWKTVVVGDKFCLIGRTIKRAQCGNAVAWTPPRGTITGAIRLVRAFTLRATAVASSTSEVSVKVSASCDNGAGSSAYATATAHAYATASATASVISTSYYAAVVTARTRASQLLAPKVATARATAIATATTTAQVQASALVVCSPVPPPPPVNQPPTISIVNGPQHVIVNDQIQICALANDADGDSLVVTFNAKYGTVSTSFRPDPVGAPQKWCATYTAPATTHTDEVISATASDGQLNASASTLPFPIAADVGF